MISRTLSAAPILCSQILALFVCPTGLAQMQPRWTESIPEGQEGTLQRALFRSIDEMEWLEAAEVADKYRAAPDSIFAQYQAFLYAMIGRADLVAKMEEEGLLLDLGSPALCTDENALVHRDALQAIVEASGRHRVVILQERHWHAQQRVLLHELLPLLHEQGFGYFAAEDFQGDPAAYEDLAYPGAAPGFHSSREPIFANAVRRAIALGYRLVPYEASFPPPDGVAPEDIQQWRVDQQAEHLHERIFSRQPEAKVLVFAGLGHASERPDPDHPDFIPMALRLKELTGLDPLTVDQVGCRLLEPELDSGAGIAFRPDGAAVVQDFPAGTFDLQVSYEAEQYEATGRAEWLTRLGRTPIAVPERLRKGGESLVVEARLVGEPADATPFDRIYLGEDETLPLMLAPGEYRVTAQGAIAGGEPIVVTVQ